MIYEGTIVYQGIDKKGNTKTIREKYLVEDAETFAEAESVLITKFIDKNDIDVVALKRSSIKEIANTCRDNERMFIATLTDVFTDDNGNEKEMAYNIAFFSLNIETAHDFIRLYSSQGYCMEMKSLKCAPFIDVIKYKIENE